MNELVEAINAAWIAAYPGEPAVTDVKKLCNRVKQLGVDRANWISNAKALQKDNEKLRRTT